MFRESGDPLELIQTEDVQYKLGGLVLIIGGIGRNNADGKWFCKPWLSFLRR